MITCERCGKEMADNLAICPSCGTITSTARSVNPPNQPSTSYGQYPPGVYNDSPPMRGYGQGYPQQQYRNRPPIQQNSVPPQQNYGYGPMSQPNPMYSPGVFHVNVVNNAGPMYGVPTPVTSKNSAALIVEILLNLFISTYGVGWLMAGETTIGIVLLICTPIYWAMAILFIIFTLGIGACIVIPLAICAIIFNAILLNKALNRKATQYIMMTQTR